MKVLCLGDVSGQAALSYMQSAVAKIKREEKIDLTIINGENADVGNGISPESANRLFAYGADVITTGNHVYKKNSVYDYLDENECIIRPLNYSPSNPGKGSVTVYCKGKRVLVMNVLGCAYMDSRISSPFAAVENELTKMAGKYDIAILDFHAESTSEKISLAHYFDGRLDLVYGTHTHVQTADERIMPKGCAFITDIGMCGVVDSALGVDYEPVIRGYLTGMPQRFTEAVGKIALCGIVYEYDENKKTSESIKRIRIE